MDNKQAGKDRELNDLDRLYCDVTANPHFRTDSKSIAKLFRSIRSIYLEDQERWRHEGNKFKMLCKEACDRASRAGKLTAILPAYKDIEVYIEVGLEAWRDKQLNQSKSACCIDKTTLLLFWAALTQIVMVVLLTCLVLI